MRDDIVIRLRRAAQSGRQPWGEGDIWWEALSADDVDMACDEIERLRSALALAVGELSRHSQYSVYSSEQLMQQFLEEARDA